MVHAPPSRRLWRRTKFTVVGPVWTKQLQGIQMPTRHEHVEVAPRAQSPEDKDSPGPAVASVVAVEPASGGGGAEALAPSDASSHAAGAVTDVDRKEAGPLAVGEV